MAAASGFCVSLSEVSSGRLVLVETVLKARGRENNFTATESNRTHPPILINRSASAGPRNAFRVARAIKVKVCMFDAAVVGVALRLQFLECGGKRSATPLWILRFLRLADPKRRRATLAAALQNLRQGRPRRAALKSVRILSHQCRWCDIQR